MENLESQQYRDELAKEIKVSPKGERKLYLDLAKEDQRYWQARDKKINQPDSQSTEEVLEFQEMSILPEAVRADFATSTGFTLWYNGTVWQRFPRFAQ